METRAEYQARARAYVEEHGRRTPTEIYQAIGDPPEGVRLAADGKGNVRARDVLQRRITQGAYNRQRAQRAQPKGETEAAYDRSMRRTAKQRSDDLIHKLAYGDEPSIAEHNQPLHQGGDASRQSISEPPFKTFKDTVESKLKKYPGYVTDIDDVTGGVRVIEEARYNQYQKPSQQRGITLEIGDDIDASLAKLKPSTNLKNVNGTIRFAGRAARFIANRADAIQTGVDIFQQGQTGSELDQVVQAVDESGLLEANVGGVAIGRNDPKTDLGRKAFSIIFEPNRNNPITEETLDFNL
jgi:hypothetical protein|tara:strand:+ start:222 stop:1112 length:891 start_codon:yes stop_codon:yes gene_type:complete